MRVLRRGVVLALAGFSLPLTVSAAPAQKGPAAKASTEAVNVPSQAPAPPASVVTEEMRSANEAASSSAEAAIASLKAARAAIAAEKSREESNSDLSGAAPTAPNNSSPAPVSGSLNTGRKG